MMLCKVGEFLRGRAVGSIVIGVASGLFGGLTGVGGGAIIVPMLVTYLKVPQHRAHGTSLAIMVLLVFFGALAYFQQGFFDPSLFMGMAVGSMVGVVLGAKLMTLIPAAPLRWIFAITIILIGLRMFFA